STSSSSRNRKVRQKRQWPRSPGGEDAAISNGHAVVSPTRTQARNWRLRYAIPDPERWVAALAASCSVLQGHRYRAVIETLSKSESGVFWPVTPIPRKVESRALRHVAAQEAD